MSQFDIGPTAVPVWAGQADSINLQLAPFPKTGSRHRIEIRCLTDVAAPVASAVVLVHWVVV